MTFMLRDRPDGQIEIVVNKPVVVGVFAEREMAEKVCLFLQEDESFGQVDDQPANFAAASADVAAAEAEAAAEARVAAAPALPIRLQAQPTPPCQERRKSTQLLVVDDRPTAPRMLVVAAPKHLTEDQANAAFGRLAAGEKLATVAPDFGITLNQLRGIWAGHKRLLQKHLAEGGQVSCIMCAKPFTPSISSPDKCARCSHD